MKNEEAFEKAGLDRKEAGILAYILENTPTFAREIERGLAMRQPEVSIVISDFEKRGWIKYKKIHGEGRGRPQHEYTLRMSKEDIIGDLKSNLGRELERIEETLNLLDDLE